MSAAAARIRAFFFESPAAETFAPAPGPGIANRVAVLGRSGSVEAVAAALALSRMGALGARSALLARWGARGRVWRMPASRAASRCALVLRDRGLPAVASGRLVRLDLSPEPFLARAELARAAAAVDGPAVLAVGVARNDEVDHILLEHDELVLVGDEELLLDRLAADSLEALGLPLQIVAPLRRGKSLVTSGLGVPAAASRLKAGG